MRGEQGKVPQPLVMMVTDRRRYGSGEQADEQLVEAVRRATRAGVNLVQVREKDLDGGDLLTLSQRIRNVAGESGARVVVNDRADVALAAAAAGVHLPAGGFAAAVLRPIVPESFLIGRSVHSEAEAIEIARAGSCDYLVFGTIFESGSKRPGHAVAGLGVLARVCAAVPVPVVAIGGITPDRVSDVAAAGAAGIAAIGMFATGTESDLTQAVRRIRAAFDNEKSNG